MQCWSDIDKKSKNDGANKSKLVDVEVEPKTSSTGTWTFSLVFTDKIYCNEQVAVSGGGELGNWNPHEALLLIPNNSK